MFSTKSYKNPYTSRNEYSIILKKENRLIIKQSEVLMEQMGFGKLSEQYSNLLKEASIAMQKAYCPYSGFSVGAALLTDEGIVVHGANFENAAYPSCICAEASAIVSANAQGYRKFKAIAVIAKGKDFDIKDIGVPCGNCRQILYEASQLSGNSIDIIMSSTQMDKIAVAPIADLLLRGFGPLDLGINISSYRK
jgi:cytidine deaminase